MQKFKKLKNYFGIMEELFNVTLYMFWKDLDGRYRGCNLNQAKAFSIDSNFIGKTAVEILSDPEEARMIEETDNAVMNSGKMIMKYYNSLQCILILPYSLFVDALLFQKYGV